MSAKIQKSTEKRIVTLRCGVKWCSFAHKNWQTYTDLTLLRCTFTCPTRWQR